ncbi:unnamed protein product [Knipowitschia caucasica]|uniref:Uncharacterized protein n=1 Tax=Knipowitschia caucasica TaxID=637954 RepID=A0AAV2LCW1_KNICA
MRRALMRWILQTTCSILLAPSHQKAAAYGRALHFESGGVEATGPCPDMRQVRGKRLVPMLPERENSPALEVGGPGVAGTWQRGTEHRPLHAEAPPTDERLFPGISPPQPFMSAEGLAQS